MCVLQYIQSSACDMVTMLVILLLYYLVNKTVLCQYYFDVDRIIIRNLTVDYSEFVRNSCILYHSDEVYQVPQQVYRFNITSGNNLNSSYITAFNKEISRQIVRISLEQVNQTTSQEFNNLCRCYNESYKIIIQWEKSEEKKTLWLKTNISVVIAKIVKIQNEFDKFGSELMTLFTYIDLFQNSVCANFSKTFNSILSEIQSSQNKDWLIKYNDRQMFFKHFKQHVHYVIFPILGTIFVIGIIGNVTTVLIILKHKEMRTWANMLILHLAIVDILNLALSLPIVVSFHVIYSDTTIILESFVCKLLNVVTLICFALSAYTVVSLSAFRFCITLKSSTYCMKKNISDKTLTLLNIIFVWVIALVVSTPIILHMKRSSNYICECVNNCIFISYWLLTFYSIFPSIIISISYAYVVYTLKQSARKMPGDVQVTSSQRNARRRSAKVFIVLAILYFFSTIPYCIGVVIYHPESVTKYNMLPHITGIDIKHFVYSSSMANPIALCFCSKLFRKYFKMYLLRCKR